MRRSSTLQVMSDGQRLTYFAVVRFGWEQQHVPGVDGVARQRRVVARTSMGQRSVKKEQRFMVVARFQSEFS